MRRLTFTAGSSTITLDVSPYLITSLEGEGAPEGNSQSQKAPYQDGSTWIATLLGNREIEVQGVIAPGPVATVLARKQALVQALSPKVMRILVLTTDRGSWKTQAVPSGPEFKNKTATDGFQSFRVTFECPDPYLYSTVDGSASAPAVQGNFRFPLSFPRSFSSPRGFSATNSGDAETPVTISLTGAMTNPAVLNLTTGKKLRLVKAMNAGDLMTITTRFGAKAVTYTPSGGSPVSGMGWLDLTSKFWGLVPGVNNLLFVDEAGGSGGACSVAWTDRFLGV